MTIDKVQLLRGAEEVDALHRQGMKTLGDDLYELHRGDTAEMLRASRRTVLGAGLGGLALTAGSAFFPMSKYLASAGAQSLDDTAIAVFAESVELAAVAAYTAGLPKLSPAVAEVGKLFASHHQEHADAFAALAGSAASGAANAALLADLTPLLTGAADEAAVLELALLIENQAASTYVFAIGALASAEAAAATATILPVESAHAVVLANALGKSLRELFPTAGEGAFESGEAADIIDPAKYPVA
jgi:hypothetical protein